MTLPVTNSANEVDAAPTTQHPSDSCFSGARQVMLTPEQSRARDALWERREAENKAEARRIQEAMLDRRCADAEALLRQSFPKRAIACLEEHPNACWPDPSAYPRVVSALSAHRSVLLLGPFGPGKTTMATKACLQLARTRGLVSRYFTAADLVSDFRFTCWEQRTSSEGAYLDRIAKVPILVIDEFDQRSESQDETSKLVRIIDRRYREMVSTVIISNLTDEQFHASQHEGMCDRLNGTAESVNCNWKSFRTPGAER